MVAELKVIVDELKKKFEDITTELRETKEDMKVRNDRLKMVEEQLAELSEIKDDFGDKLAAKLASMEANMDQTKGIQENTMQAIIEGAQKKFDDVEQMLKNTVDEAQKKFAEVDLNYNQMYQQAKLSFENLDHKINMGSVSRDKRAGFLPDKLMVPQKFAEDITQWRKWKEEVTKYFDESREGIKGILDEIGNMQQPITVEVLRAAGERNPHKVADLEKWKHLYRALEKLTDGEAAKVVSTVTDENGFEAWRQLHLRFEPQLQAQKNTVLLELHNMTAAATIEETKNKMVELKVRIAKAENILGMNVQDMQKKTALLQILDLVTKQHTATLVDAEFNTFYTKVMNFTNNASVGQGGGNIKSINEKNDTDNSKEDEPDDMACGMCGDACGGGLHAMQRQGTCHLCGQFGHYRHECPNKGKGKGKGGGLPKGKGKGGGPQDGCWTCGGNHRRAECPHNPWNQGGGKSMGKKGATKGQGSGKGGKGWINNLQDTYQTDGYWPQEAVDFFGSLRTIEPEEGMTTAKMPCTWTTRQPINVYNKYGVLEAEEDEQEDADDQEETGKLVQERVDEDVMDKSMFDVLVGKDDEANVKDIGGHQGEVRVGAALVVSDSAGTSLLVDSQGGISTDKNPAFARLSQGIQGQQRWGQTPRALEPTLSKDTFMAHVETGAGQLDGRTSKRKKMIRVKRWKKDSLIKEEPMDDMEVSEVLSNEAVEYVKNYADKVGLGKIKQIRTVEPETINSVSADGRWEKLQLAVDSGATESVIPPSMPECVPTEESAASRRGVKYEVASGHYIPNEGEKQFDAITDQGTKKRMILQVCDVTQGLLSVSKVAKAGNRVVFDDNGSFIQNKNSGDITWMEERGGMYMLTLWVKRPF